MTVSQTQHCCSSLPSPSLCPELYVGFTRILRDAKEAFRDAPAHSIPLRQACTKPQPGSAAAVSPSQNADPSRRRPGGKAAGALGLKEFMHRTRVLDLYRGILKVSLPVLDFRYRRSGVEGRRSSC